MGRENFVELEKVVRPPVQRKLLRGGE
eukprot:SAG11_NODE_16921_length_533_cov_1.654378_1_plen_26_part_01